MKYPADPIIPEDPMRNAVNGQDLSSAPTVAPKEGDYVRLRNGREVGPLRVNGSGWTCAGIVWNADGTDCSDPKCPYRIVAILHNPNAPEQEDEIVFPQPEITRRGKVAWNDETVSVEQAASNWIGARASIAHDGFVGTIIGHYTRLDGKRGVVMQQDGTNVVHVYGEKWLQPVAQALRGNAE